MSVAARERPEFTPPTEGGLARSVGLALLAHAVLVLALSWGLKWKREDDAVAVEAELWSNAPQAAAPKPVEAPPPPPPAPRVAAPPPPPAPARQDADIALAREREEQRLAQERAREQAEAERQKQLAERRRQQELERQEQARQEQARRAAEEKRREEQARRAAEEKRREEQARARRAQQDEERLAKLREENLRRIQGLAGATGPRESTGTAARSSGPSASYAGRLAAHFHRHVVFPGGVGTIVGNPEAEVQVRVSPTGEILSVRLSRSSGNPAWDEAAVRAIERSERIPPDVNGSYVTDLTVGMRPKRG